MKSLVKNHIVEKTSNKGGKISVELIKKLATNKKIGKLFKSKNLEKIIIKMNRFENPKNLDF